MKSIHLKLINQSADPSPKLVIFQRNEAAPGDIAIAWRVITLGSSPTTLDVPLDYRLRAEDSFGGTLPIKDTIADPRNVSVTNDLKKGAIDVSVLLDGKPVATRTGVAPDQNANFRFRPVLLIGLTPDAVEGEIFNCGDLAPTEIPLDQGSELNVVLSGGDQKPFRILVYPIAGKRVLVLERDGWEYVERQKGKEAVAVIATTDDGKVILTEQYRRPVDAKVIDWPAGLVGDDGEDDPEKTARKELEEETGYTCNDLEFLAKGPTSPGITSELVSFYRAKSAEKTGEHEKEITVHVVPLDGIRDWLDSRGEVMIDLKVWGGLYFLT